MMNNTEIAALRRNYTLAGLSEADVLPNPFAQFDAWFQEAVRTGAGEANAMTLATATLDGTPSARIVLLKGVDERGFVFYSNYESTKGRALAANPKVCLNFFWEALERQVRIQGVATRVPREEAEVYFRSRPFESRIGAWSSRQSERLENRAVLENRFAELRAEYDGKDIPIPPFWGGYLVEPHAMEFWQGRTGRLHDRILYERDNDNRWIISRLSP
jgi:pyridoxamine 5'-phosphate oxidase